MKKGYERSLERESSPAVPVAGFRRGLGRLRLAFLLVSLVLCPGFLPTHAMTGRAADEAAEDAAQKIASLAASLREASARGDVAAIIKVREELETLVIPEDAAATLEKYRQYFLAAADFRVGAIDRKQGVELLDRCLKRLQEVLKAHPDFVEALVLQATCAGTLLSSAPKRAVELSMLSQQALQLAKELEPENPRAAFVEGLSVFFMPENFGGGPEKALHLFEEAVRRFEAGVARDPIVRWGKDEAYMWLGIARSITGDKEGALEALQQAVALNPHDRWISQFLIPKVKAGESLGPVFGIR